MAVDAEGTQGLIDTDVDHFPTLADALSRLADSTTAGQEPVSRLDLRFDASGYGYYRLWIWRDDEHLVGSIPVPGTALS